MNEIIRIKNLEAWYGELQVLRGIDMSINKGDVVAIIGPNGSGKSTTIKCLLGLLNKKKGEIIFKGKRIENMKPHDIVKLGISYVPQGRMIFSSLTVEENLLIGGFTIKNKKILRERLDYIYKKFPVLEERKNQNASFLSGGQQQMLSIGRALMLDPEVLVLDEPSMGLAPKIIEEVFKKIEEINKEGKTIIIIEQNVHLALEIATNVYVLITGKAKLSGRGHKLEGEKIIKEFYLGGGGE